MQIGSIVSNAVTMPISANGGGSGRTVVEVVIDDQRAGSLELADPVKPAAREAIARAEQRVLLEAARRTK